MKLTRQDLSSFPCLYESRTASLYLWQDSDYGKPVVIKLLRPEALADRAAERLVNEYRVTKDLDIKGIRRPCEMVDIEGRPVLIMEYVAGQTLMQSFVEERRPLPEVLVVAISICRILESLHGRRYIHCNINSRTIFVDPSRQEATLIGFGSAVKAESKTGHAEPPDLDGISLHYVSPEQTGRINQPIDHRTDLYGLGVVLYQMLAAELPFTTESVPELIYCHLAKLPRVLNEVNPEVPKMVSDIVMKLLAKSPDDRYQSAYGLRADLEHCLQQLRWQSEIDSFVLAKDDNATVFRIPHKLYGRDAEIRALVEAADAAREGEGRVLLVTGGEGVGKTALLDDAGRYVASLGGFWLSGSYDQRQKNIPYHAVIQAASGLVDRLLTENADQLARWQERIRTTLGDNIALLAEVIPRLELIVGRQSSAHELTPVDRQNRLYSAFQSLIRTIADARPPLVLVLDNLQWADPASIELFKLLTLGTENQPFVLVGACRDNEIEPSHPLAEAIAGLHQGKRALQVIHLENISRSALTGMIADTLKCEKVYVQTLSDLIYEKTGGNALFAVQLFQLLHDEGLLSFVGFPRHWEWDTEQIRSQAITDNVITLMTRKIGKLTAETREQLSLAACIGSSFSLGLLALLAGKTIDETRDDLVPAIEEGLVVLMPKISVRGPEDGGQGASRALRFMFLHERVRQVAYSLISRRQRRLAHLKIGRLLVQESPDGELDDMVFAVTDHFNEGFPFIDSEQERERLIQLNLLAGRKARRAAASQAAIWYLSMGIGMLPADKWESRYDLTLDLYMEAVEAEYLCTNFERVELLASELLSHARDLLVKVRACEVSMMLHTARNLNASAIEAGIRALALLDVVLPTEHEEIQAYIRQKRKELAETIDAVDTLAQLPILQETRELAARRILMGMADPAHQSDPGLLPSIILTVVLQSLRHGNSPMSALAYVWYAALLCGPYRDIEQGHRFGRLSLDVLQQFKETGLEVKILSMYNVLVRHWRTPAGEIVKTLEEIMRREGFSDPENACYAAVHACGYSFCAGAALPHIRQIQAKCVETTDRFRLKFYNNLARVWAQMVVNLSGAADDPRRLSGDLFNEAEILPTWMARHESVLVFNALGCRILLQYLFRDFTGAIESARLVEEYAQGGEGYIYQVQFKMYHALALLAHYPEMDDAERQDSLLKVGEILERMKTWADDGPMNCGHKCDLIEAEKARVTGDRLRAMECYGRAMKGAREHGFIHEEALCYECEAMLQSDLGRKDLAGFDIVRATELYRLWGAAGKVDDLQRRNRHLFDRDKPVSLDTAAIINAMHLLSREIRTDQLLDRLMHLVMENVGAEKGIFIENRDGQLVIQAKSEGTGGAVETMQGVAVVEDGEVPLSVVNYVVRTQQPVVLSDACRDSIYAHDRHISRNRTRSLLCLPMVHQGKLAGLLYLENNLAANVFTPDRLELLKTLSSQAAISMLNAGLYASLEATIRELRQAESAARDSQSLLRAIIDNSTAIIYVKNLRGGYLLINRRFEEVFRLSGPHVLGKTDVDLFPDSQAEALSHCDRQAVDTAGPVESELELSQVDGLHTYISIVCPLFNNEGKPFAVFGILTDITERKRVEDALADSERKFRAIFEQTFQFIGLMTIDGVVIEANNAALRLVGIEESEVIGRPFWQAPWWSHSPELQERLREAVNKAAAGEFVRFEATHPAADGSLHYVDFSLKPVRDDSGEVILLIPEGRDITERKLAEEELRKSRDHLDELVRQRTAEVTEANEQLRQEIRERKKIEEAMNKRLVALTEPLETTSISFADLFNIDDLQKIQDAFAEAFNVSSLITTPDGMPITRPSRFCRLCSDIIRQTEKGMRNCMVSDSVIGRQNPDGPTIELCQSGGLWDAGASITLAGKHVANWLVGQVKNEAVNEGRLLGYAAEIGADIDEFRLALQEVPVMSTAQFTKIADLLFLMSRELSLKAYQNVQQARFITERRQVEEDLLVAMEHAEAANQAKSTFLSSMSHELRTPLNAILGYAQILSRQQNLTEAQLQQVEIMRNSGEHLLMLINDILDVGKIEACKMQLVEAPFNLPSMLRQVFNITRIKADEKRLSFIYETPTPLPDYVRGDERKLKQVLLNLLGNAVKYTHQGKITLRVSYGVAGPAILRAEVQDTGIGIARDKLEAIFEPFTQLTVEGRPYEGAGLGLTISRQLSELLQGSLGVESQPGKGSTFWLDVPLPAEVRAGNEAAGKQWNISGYSGVRKTILVVDDIDTNSSLLVNLLEPLGFVVGTAGNGMEAVRLALADCPDLVILDLVMPEMDGLSTAREMRRHRRLDAVKIIGVSASATDSRLKEEFINACDDFILKPVQIDELLEKISMVLDIEWLTTPVDKLETTELEAAEELPFEVPSQEEMAELYELAKRGDLRGVQRWVVRIGDDQRYKRFTGRLRELAGRFKTKAVQALVEKHMSVKQ